MTLRHVTPITIGPIPAAGAVTVNAASIAAATTRLLLGLLPPVSKTLSKVKVYVSAVTGTLGANDIVCELWSMPTGVLGSTTAPASLLESRNTVTAVPTGASWVEITGFTSALTAGTMYALVFRNVNGTPASNNFSIRWVTGLLPTALGSTSFGWVKRQSADSGSTYGTNVGGVGGYTAEMSDGTVIGIPASNAAVLGSGDGIYSARELGAEFTTPSQAKPRVVGVLFICTATGSPSGKLLGRLYEGTTLLATTEAAPARSANSNFMFCYFTSPVELKAGTAHKATVGETTQSDTSGNRFNLYGLTLEASGSQALMPLAGWKKALLDGTWTVTDTEAVLVALVLDGDQPFSSVAPGPSLQVHPPAPPRRRGATSLAIGAVARVSVVSATPPPAFRVVGPAPPRVSGAAFARGAIARTDTAIVLATPAPGISLRGAPAPGRRRGAAVQHGAVARVDTTTVAATPPPRIQVSGPRPVSRR